MQTCQESVQVAQTSSNKEMGCEPQATFWEWMKLRLSQPSPKLAPFDGDPAKYLRFRANFWDRVECKKSLSESERLSYTTGRAKAVVKNSYNELPNGCQLALKVLEHRFGQSAMIVQALKSSVTDGPKIRPGENAALLALSDKTENYCWVILMTELQSCELDCTTNLRYIYDRLPGHLQENGERLQCRIVSGQVEGSRAYGSCPSLLLHSVKLRTTRCMVERANHKESSVLAGTLKKRAPQERDGPTIPTPATEVRIRENRGNQGTRKSVTTSEQGGNGSNLNQAEYCKVCK